MIEIYFLNMHYIIELHLCDLFYSYFLLVLLIIILSFRFYYNMPKNNGVLPSLILLLYDPCSSKNFT